MGLFPEIASQPNTSLVSNFGPECEAGFNSNVSGIVGATGTITQNRIYLTSVRIETPRTFVVMGWKNGTTSNGNCAAGIYTMAGARLDYTAHTAQGTVSETQGVALTNANVLLQPGLYWWAFGSDSATATFFRSAPALNLARIWGCAGVVSGYANPLPATLTPAWPAVNSLPFVWASMVAVQ